MHGTDIGWECIGGRGAYSVRGDGLFGVRGYVRIRFGRGVGVAWGARRGTRAKRVWLMLLWGNASSGSQAKCRAYCYYLMTHLL